jgi:hypothetical protein
VGGSDTAGAEPLGEQGGLMAGRPSHQPDDEMHDIPLLTSEEFESLATEDAADLLRERFRAVIKRGLGVEVAVIIGIHAEIDIDEATNLIRRGCPPATAVRILR